MKKTTLALSVMLIAAISFITACTDTKTADPCDGLGMLNIANKLDSTISIKIMETHDTKSIAKDYTLPFSLAGNQPYTITIDGPQYHKDTTFMLLNCDNKLFVIEK